MEVQKKEVRFAILASTSETLITEGCPSIGLREVFVEPSSPHDWNKS